MTIDGETRRARAAVPRARDAEPDRVRGHVSAARGAARPLPAPDRVGYPAASTRSRCCARRLERGVDEVELSRWSTRPTLMEMQRALEQVHVSDAIDGLHRRPRDRDARLAAAGGRRQPARQPRPVEALAREGGAGRTRLRGARGREGGGGAGARAPADAAARALGAAASRRGRRGGGARDGADALRPRTSLRAADDAARLAAARRLRQARRGRPGGWPRRSAASSRSRSPLRSRSRSSPPCAARTRRSRRMLAIDRERVIEGDEVTRRSTSSSPRGVDRFDRPAAAAAGARAAGRDRARDPPRAGEPRTLELTLRCERWGAFLRRRRRSSAPATCSASAPGRRSRPGRSRCGCIPATRRCAPCSSRSTRRSSSGNQVSRARGDGIEFADMREWEPGDRVREHQLAGDGPPRRAAG